MKNSPWSREQLLKALALYCQIPFGKMHYRNPTVKALAKAIRRTPSAVALKLVNFASLDADLRGRGIAGMGNSSKADREIWQEFYGKWEALSDALVKPDLATEAEDENDMTFARTQPTEALGTVKQRRGQSFFRSAVLAAYEGKCCITGISTTELLRASHIVPWSADPLLRLDPRNGLCLNALHDAAFDTGLVTFSDKYELVLSKRIKEELPTQVYSEFFRAHEGSQLQMPERFRPTQTMLDFHRSNLFKG